MYSDNNICQFFVYLFQSIKLPFNNDIEYKCLQSQMFQLIALFLFICICSIVDFEEESFSIFSTNRSHTKKKKKKNLKYWNQLRNHKYSNAGNHDFITF